MNNIQKALYAAFSIVLLMFGVACSTSEDDKSSEQHLVGVRTPGSGSALSLPRSIVVGEANVASSSTTNSQSTSGLIQAAAATDPGTDYSSDPVNESSLADSNLALEFINTMLCLLDEINATGKVNQGAFLGSVPYNICNQDGKNSANVNRKIDLVVNSTRVDNNSPQYIQIWMDDAWTSDPLKFIMEIVIYQEVNDQYPFGKFDVNYLGYSAPSIDTPLSDWQIDMRTSIRSTESANGLPRFEFLLDQSFTDNDVTYNLALRSITQITSSDLQNGQSRFAFEGSYGSFPFSEYTESIFNSDVSLEINSDLMVGNSCYSRTNVLTDVWGYNLYDAVSGQRIPEQPNPLSLSYVDAQGNSYSLYYWGPQQLSGLPYDTTTYVAEIIIPDGSLLTDTNGTEYLVKAVDIIYMPQLVDLTNCSVLDASAPSNNPDLNVDVLPAIVLPGFSLSDWPTL